MATGVQQAARTRAHAAGRARLGGCRFGPCEGGARFPRLDDERRKRSWAALAHEAV
jgi:hypothetical protein